MDFRTGTSTCTVELVLVQTTAFFVGEVGTFRMTQMDDTVTQLRRAERMTQLRHAEGQGMHRQED
jgi:hypothetical protein